ncbi:MAG: glycosyltransferase, partial [Firmicutes bacterium]|nr:glycosyltransferase [Bacillota bacterium]
KKVIFDSHERYPEQIRCKHYLPKILRNTIAALYGRYENHILKKIDGVIFPCTMDGKNPFEGLCKRAAIVPNYAILSEFPPLSEGTEKKRQVCYVGGLTEARGIRNCILASAKADVTLALGGAFDSAEFENDVRSLPEFSVVDHRGVLDRGGVAALLAESMAGFCVLQDRGQYLKIDTFGIKVYEYMSSGLPVILSHSKYNDRMVEKYRMGICVDPMDVDDIASAVTRLVDHPEEAAMMGKRGYAAVNEEFNWGAAEKVLLDLYEDILR